jgi:hypothetical protein
VNLVLSLGGEDGEAGGDEMAIDKRIIGSANEICEYVSNDLYYPHRQ